MLYGGNVLGKFEELVPEKRIQQSWRLKNWSSGHYSNVVIELEETVSGSIVHNSRLYCIGDYRALSVLTNILSGYLLGQDTTLLDTSLVFFNLL